MFIDCYQVSDGVYEVKCTVCCQSLGTHERAYIDWLMLRKEQPYCFDCEPEGDEVPDIFKNYWDFTYLFGEADYGHTKVFQFDPQTGKVSFMMDIFHRPVVSLWQAMGGDPACLFVHNRTDVKESGSV